MSDVTYIPSDLPSRYRAILDEAKAGGARVRDSDGTTILLLPEADVRALRTVSAAATNLAVVERVADQMSSRRPGASDYGEWSWLDVFDADDLSDFVREIREAIIVGAREGSAELLDEQLRAWRLTAQQAGDPLFRAVLHAGASEEDFVEVVRPTRSASSARQDAGAAVEDAAE